MSLQETTPGQAITFESLFGTEEARAAFPAPFHPTWEVVDSTKIAQYRDCPRKFLFKYVFGWSSIYPSIHLVFGGAWHEAHEFLTLNGYSQANIDHAYAVFEQEFRKHFPEHMDNDLKGKTPAAAKSGLQQYVAEWALIDSYSNLHTEVSLKVPIGNGRYIYCKIDAINQIEGTHEDGLIFADDHKTGSRQMGYWADMWAKRFQFNAYTHAMHCFYPAEKIKGLRVNGAFFSLKNQKFDRCWVKRTVEQLREWIFVANDLYDKLLADFQKLKTSTKQEDILSCFLPNDARCFDYFSKCEFFDICNYTQNPLIMAHEPPSNYKVEFWDPREGSTKWEANIEEGKIKEVEVPNE